MATQKLFPEITLPFKFEIVYASKQTTQKMVLLTIALVIFHTWHHQKVNVYLFFFYQFLFINGAFSTCKGLHVDELVFML